MTNQKDQSQQEGVITRQQKFYKLTAQQLKEDYKEGFLTATGYLHYLIRALRKEGWKLHISNISIFCEEWGISERSFHRAKATLISRGLGNELPPEWLTQTNNIEHQIRDRLHQQLGGLKEVSTATGRIDLLTDEEIIEVKRIEEWKAALGQVLAGLKRKSKANKCKIQSWQTLHVEA